MGSTLILGASSDIGTELIKGLDGDIIAHYRTNKQKLDNIQGKNITCIYGDFSTEDGILEFIQNVKALGQDITKIVHLPAPLAKATKFKKFNSKSFLLDINVSVLSFSLVCKEFAPIMAKNGFGKIAVMLTSYCIGTPPKFLSSYVSSKYALMGITKSLAVEYADKGLTFNAVAPSMVETSFLETLPDFEIQSTAQKSPLKRNGSPKDVANVLKFLLCDDNEYLNGAIVPITSGMVL